jgi:tetratricopeptide (TPR) repeat protein
MKKYFLIFLLLCSMISCKKIDSWLEKKANKSDVVPSTINDYKLILNNTDVMNSNYVAGGLMASDNYYLTYAAWQAATSAIQRNAHVWKKEIYEGAAFFDWTNAYAVVENCNIILDGLQKIERIPHNQSEWDSLKGQALFFRAYTFYNLLQIFSKPYSKSSAATDLGIPLRVSSDVNLVSKRSSVEQCYKKLILDLLDAEPLLPSAQPFKTQPTKSAVYGLLARLYLTMGDYPKAYTFSHKILESSNTIIDFNTLNAALTFPMPTFQQGNSEVLFYSVSSILNIQSNANLLVVPELYNSYEANDLRKSIFFKDNGSKGIAFRGYYTGLSGAMFGGIAVNEMILIRAECLARNGNTKDAINDLNDLLRKRWNKNIPYTSKVAANAVEALRMILIERRKELPFTGNLRWEDLRRLNQDPRFAVTLTRTLNNETFTLTPNDGRYVYAIPDDEIRLSGMEQNSR